MVGRALQTSSLSAHLGRKFERWDPSCSGQAKLASLWAEEGERRGAKGQTVDLDGEGRVKFAKAVIKIAGLLTFL